MKKENILHASLRGGKAAFLSSAVLLAMTAIVGAQSAVVVPTSAADAMQRRVARARALAAAHDLAAAATELDAIHSAATDSSIRDVARIMLMGIYLEQGDYTRAGAVLDGTYKARVAQDENSTRSYFALAGQTVNGARAHLERYREFGINVADKELPPEAVNDLDRLRLLLEHVADQAKNISSEDPKSNDSIALLEDVSSVRGSLARNERERSQWQREFAEARQKLAANETRVATSRGAMPRTSAAAFAAAPSVNNQIITSDNNGSRAAASPNPNTRSSASRSNATSAKTKGDAAASRAPEGNASSAVSSTSRDASSTAAKQTAAANPNGLLDVGSLIDKATQKISPSYPPTAKSARVAGVVTVYLVVDEKGAVTSVERTNGPQLLRLSAQEAARRWKFRPTLVDGQPTRVAGFISFNFAL